MKRLFILFISLASVTLLLGCRNYNCISCKDYGYTIHFHVEGGHGGLNCDQYYSHRVFKCNPAYYDCQKLGCGEDYQNVSTMGSKKGSLTITFIATPNEGYQVKEWLFNGKVVEGNKTNTYDATVSHKDNYYVSVAVKFEPIPNITE